ncbi:hypothetical protein V5F23_09945 [Pseudomonas sp. WP18]|uniref:hypothetical protein n=1 Tax=Pseudomonas sp. WP18 TaxID=3118752 RepID=UPI0030D0D5CF
MNFQQAKALRIKQWRDTLDDQDFRRANPEAHRSILHDMSARLAEENLIDRLEQFDMDEMANAAYWLAIEELHANPVVYRSSYGYDVMPRGGGPRFGTLFHSVLMLDEDSSSKMRGFDGKIYHTENGLELNQDYHHLHGTVEGLVLTLKDGRQFDLVETKGMVQGVIYDKIDDPDVYRWMTDLIQVATENKLLKILLRIRPFYEMARFVQCLTCLDRFGKREDCGPCAGKGFVEKPLIPEQTSTGATVSSVQDQCK